MGAQLKLRNFWPLTPDSSFSTPYISVARSTRTVSARSTKSRDVGLPAVPSWRQGQHLSPPAGPSSLTRFNLSGSKDTPSSRTLPRLPGPSISGASTWPTHWLKTGTLGPSPSHRFPPFRSILFYSTICKCRPLPTTPGSGSELRAPLQPAIARCTSKQSKAVLGHLGRVTSTTASACWRDFTAMANDLTPPVDFHHPPTPTLHDS